MLSCRRHSWTHPEGWRDWPDETPATPAFAGRCQFLRDVWRVVPLPGHTVAGEERKGEPQWLLLSSPVANAAPTTRSRRAYVCNRCFGPLEVKYANGHLKADLPELRRRIQSGPQNIWRYADFLPRRGAARPEHPRDLARRACPPAARRWCGPTASPSASACARSGSRTTRRTPRTRSRTASSPSPAQRARELGFDTLACASTGNLANAVAAAGAALGVDDLRLHPVRPRGAEDPRDRRLRHEPGQGQGQLRRRQPPLHRALGRARVVGVRQRQPAARTTPRAPRRSPTRSPSSSAGRRPTASSRRSPRARCTPRSPRASTSGASSG